MNNMVGGEKLIGKRRSCRWLWRHLLRIGDLLGSSRVEDALQDFERGIALTRACRQSLSDAEQKVQILLEQNDEAEPETFNDSD